MTTLVCSRCGCSNPDLNPRCRACGTPLPEITNEATSDAKHEVTNSVAHDGVVGSELASEIAMLAARRYHRLAELARGGSGRIVAARDLVFDRSVAIKEPLEPARDGPRLRAEADILACLPHPSIGPGYDTGVWTEGTPCVAMKLVEGRSLRDVIDDAPGLAQRLALIPHLVAVADAIAYAHSEGVIHRDLKPGNVLVGQFGETVVIDWGLAKRVRSTDVPDAGHPDPGPARARVGVDTATGAILGTPAYMAPEQARGDRRRQSKAIDGQGVRHDGRLPRRPRARSSHRA